jgi:hypothetical protein
MTFEPSLRFQKIGFHFKRNEKKIHFRETKSKTHVEKKNVTSFVALDNISPSSSQNTFHTFQFFGKQILSFLSKKQKVEKNL